jgi:hypothetical protein
MKHRRPQLALCFAFVATSLAFAQKVEADGGLEAISRERWPVERKR